jgi:hypothetical protein
LMNSLDSDNYSLVLLDFNLAEDKSGSDLINAIREKDINIPILIMLGTFDNTDDVDMESYKNIDRIVKPFESSKFLAVTDELIAAGESTAPLEEDTIEFGGDETLETPENTDTEDFPEEISDEQEDLEELSTPETDSLQFGISEDPKEDDNATDYSEIDEEENVGEGWELDAPSATDIGVEEGFHIEENIIEETSSETELENEEEVVETSSLASEMEGWGMSMPSVIGAEASEEIFPPVIQSLVNDKIDITNIGAVLKSEDLDLNMSASELADKLAGNSIDVSEENPEDELENSSFHVDEDSNEIKDAIEMAIEQLAEEEEETQITNPSVDFTINVHEEDSEELSLESTAGESTVVADPDEEDMSFPGEDDLSYPDMSNIDYSGSVMGPTSSLVPLDELAPDGDPLEEGLEKTDPQYAIPPSSAEMAEEIHNESSPEEFWAADDGSRTGSLSEDRIDEDLTQEFKIDDFVSGAGAVADIENFKRKEESFLKAQKASGVEEVFEIEVDNEVIIEKIKESLMPQIENMIREICREKVEEISWEVIPDLAQNLITKEIKAISDSIDE